MINQRQTNFRRLLVANRSEIAIRVFRASVELGIATIAIYSQEDRFALHRFKADEAYLIGRGMGPIEAYLSIDEVIRVARENAADAIHPGYGFLAENPEFSEACADAGIVLVGPRPEIMRALGNKVAAREIALSAEVPVVPATGPLPHDRQEAAHLAREVGFPVMLKASWGGGGRGMRTIENEAEFADAVEAARRECLAAFGNDEVYLEKLIRHARHVEVQILGDNHGNLVHLHERDCSVQRRNQKIVEQAPAHYLDEATRAAIHESALRIGRAVGYNNAGTVEFLVDDDTGSFHFIEVNPRIQVEHTVTEMVTGVDLVKAQIRIAGGAAIGAPDSEIPGQDEIRVNGHAMQCRVTTEDPENNFIPDYGVLTAYRGATGFDVRLDGGTAYSGARITPFYDSLLEKVTVWAPTFEEAIRRMDRSIREFRIRGVATNLAFLENVIGHRQFLEGACTTRFVDETPELFTFAYRRDRATRLLRYLGNVIVNGNGAVEGRPEPPTHQTPNVPEVSGVGVQDGSRQLFDALGPEAFAQWMLDQEQVLMTDTTFRDAHQSLLATRVRSYDLVAIAPVYARLLPRLFSVECWGGATFDVAMRFLNECPWAWLERLRAAMPNILTQMLLRASNGVGYTTYPDNVVRYFVRRSAENGIDLFRIFDSLNWVENMRTAMDAVLETGKLCEAAICYTGDITDPNLTKYDLKYYVALARELEAAGAHILGLKDMAGLCKPAAARTLVETLKQEIGIPIHFHTHDTSGISAASVLAAVEAGVDAVDAAMDSMSGLTSQPSFGSITAALRHSGRDPGIDPDTVMMLSTYWEQVRNLYRDFESDFRAGTSDVYDHGIPGGQYTNLREQARALGIDNQRWPEVSRAFAEVNRMFGDIVKVTPSSKVVGDMALMMVTGGLTPEDVVSPEREIAFPESVVSLFAGELGQPHGGFPRALQEKILKGREPITVRPGSVLSEADLEAERAEAEKKAQRPISDVEFASWLMYPQVFTDYVAARREYSDVSVLPTPVFFYGMEPGEEISVDIDRGRTLFIRYLTRSETDRKGECTVFFELNGQPRTVRVADRSAAASGVALPKAEEGNTGHVGAPMPGMVTKVFFAEGEAIEEGDVLAAIEAMKMETVIRAEHGGVVEKVVASVGTTVDAKDLLIVIGDA